MKYLGIHLTKCVQDLFNEKQRTLLREIEEDPNRALPHVHHDKTQHVEDVSSPRLTVTRCGVTQNLSRGVYR